MIRWISSDVFRWFIFIYINFSTGMSRWKLGSIVRISGWFHPKIPTPFRKVGEISQWSKKTVPDHPRRQTLWSTNASPRQKGLKFSLLHLTSKASVGPTGKPLDLLCYSYLEETQITSWAIPNWYSPKFAETNQGIRKHLFSDFQSLPPMLHCNKSFTNRLLLRTTLAKKHLGTTQQLAYRLIISDPT